MCHGFGKDLSMRVEYVKTYGYDNKLAKGQRLFEIIAKGRCMNLLSPGILFGSK